MIQLTEAQESAIMKDAAMIVANRLYDDNKDKFDFVSPAQAGGVLDLSQAALKDLPIPRYVLSNSKIVRYKLSEILQFINSRREG